MEQIIYLDQDDEITTIRDRLDQAQSGRVILVLPERYHVLASLVNLKLLQRHAIRRGLDLILVTPERQIRNLAQSVALPVYPTLEKGQQAPAREVMAGEGRRTKEELLALRPGSSAPGRAQPTIQLRPWMEAGSPSSAARRLGAAAVLLVTLLLLGILILGIMPSALVTIVPATEGLSETVTVLASPDVRSPDAALRQVPASSVQVLVEDAATTETTGKKKIPDARATGKVIFANRSGTTVNIPKGTIVRTTAGVPVKFRTTADGTIGPGAWEKTELPVEAVDPGLGGNLPAWSINAVDGPLAFALGVVNDAPMTGGTEREVKFVSAADRSRLQATLSERLQATGLQELQKSLKPGDVLIPSTIAISFREPIFDHAVNDESPVLGLRLRGTVTGLIVSANHLQQLGEAILKAKAGEEQIFLSDSLKKEVLSGDRPEGNDAWLSLKLTGRVASNINVAEVLRLVRGQRPDVAEEILASSLPLARRPVITVEGSLLGLLPWLDFRIQVRVVSE